MKVTRTSSYSGVTRTLDLPITSEGLMRWEAGVTLIQNEFPHLSPDQREFIMSGITKEEWDEIFSEGDAK